MTDDNSPQPSTDRPEPAAAPTLRSSLRDRRQQVVEKLYTDRRVPRLDPPVMVRFRPLPGATIDRLTKAVEKGKDPDRSTVQNALALAEACQGIFEIIDGEEVSIDDQDRDGEWPRFDAHLCRLLGIPETGRASDVVRALYLTDGDVISEAGELTVWSGFARREGDEDYSGN